MINTDLVIIGGGPAGLAAAVKAYDLGVKVTIIERDVILGGVLNQCIHNGFGLTRFKESLTGPEYADRFINQVYSRNIEIMLETTVLDVSKDKTVTATSPRSGIEKISAKAVVFATGCRERSRGAINVAGERPAGVFSAGTAQRYVNLNGYSVGKEIVILGSGDIGLIMARRMTLEGAKVKAVCEIMPYSSGLKRNIEQCLNDFDIPLYLNTTIAEIKGKERVEGVVIAKVDQNKNIIESTKEFIPCDTVLFSVGLIPENELIKKLGLKLDLGTKGVFVDQYRQTELEGFFACGNTLQVHDLVDYVSLEAEIAGESAGKYILGERFNGKKIGVSKGNGLLYALPQKIDITGEEDVKLFFRVNAVYKDVAIRVTSGEREVFLRKKKSLTPGEMETLVLSKNIIKELKEDIKVELVWKE